MKRIGAVLILAAAAFIGLSLLREKKRRLEAYRTSSFALGLLRGELLSRGAQLKEGIESACKASEGMGERSFAEIWEEALTESCAGLEDGARKELQRLGTVLGRFDLEIQLQALETCKASLEERWNKRSESYPADRRMICSIVLALSSFLVILLY